MGYWGRLGISFLMLLPTAMFVEAAGNSPLPQLVANDNRTPGGQLKDGVLNLRLELSEGRWCPEDEGGDHVQVYAFAEEGRAPQNPGPLIRVPQGTEIHATVRNTLPLAARVYGLHRHPGDSKDALTLAPGEARELKFIAGEPGTYMYWATTSAQPLRHRDEAETVLAGAFVVDPPGARPDDRIFVIGMWTKFLETPKREEIPFVNGKSWPYSEHVTYDAGETIHWRVLNSTFADHAMHLHGFYFTVDGAGDGENYDRYSPEQRRTVVTEHVGSGHVFEMTWTPERAGNWIFHCHMMAHMTPSDVLHPHEMPAAYSPVSDPSAGMGGLVIGITVRPGATPAVASVAASPAHKLQLVISEDPAKVPLYKLEVNDPARAPQADAKYPELLGPPILLTRGEATEIEVKNQSTHPTAIHWHGIELESYYDGVPGWTGSGQQTTPPVAPGQSFVARMIPPKAGTFIYHTHWHDPAQLQNGVYGPLIVLEPGQKYDPAHDLTFLFSSGKYAPFGYMLLLNGSPEPRPISLQAGTRYRWRLINITDNLVNLRVRLTSNDAPVQWKIIAKDGMDLPPAQLRSSVADMEITVGETYDVEFQADSPGTAELHSGVRQFPVRVTQVLTFVAAK
ncbi:MAG: multicopper oxidase domain-containing protein [Acidobacteriia bacterium]|nr:multicopper oxidase domain-containing protein [Terriglobia bacterium]